MIKVSFFLEGGVVNTIEIPDKTWFQVNVNLLEQIQNDFIVIHLENRSEYIQKSKLLMFNVIEELEK